jgi:hypothetical protein
MSLNSGRKAGELVPASQMRFESLIVKKQVASTVVTYATYPVLIMK